MDSHAAILNCKVMALLLCLDEKNILPRRRFLSLYQALLGAESRDGTLPAAEAARQVDTLFDALSNLDAARNAGF